jgi:hypothetical protein
MGDISELADGIELLDLVIADVATKPHDWNEANTRFHIIDKVIRCLGWADNEFDLEKAQGREYSDYEIGSPVQAIWEAKREGKTFEIPVKKRGGIVHGLASVCLTSPTTKDAIHQVNNYCISRGVEIAVATNGHQFVAFRAVSKLDDSTKAKCVVFESLENLRINFARAWQLLSPGGIEAGSLFTHLDQSAAPRPPEKLSAAIPDYPQFRQQTELQRSLSDMAELLLLSVEEQGELEEEFFQSCYCESGALSQHALIGKKLLAARYASLFPDAEDAPEAQPVRGKDRKAQLTPAVLADAISNRPIALVGDVGVGKTSFLKHLMYVSAYAEFQHALYAYVDLGRKGALSESLQETVLDQIESAFLENHDIDVLSADFIQAVYKKDVRRFETGIYGGWKTTNPDKYEDKLIEMLAEKQANRAEHLRNAISYLSSQKRKQIIIALDNADQRPSSIQSEAFVIAQNLASEWKATVFISIRPKTFFFSKRAGALSAYPHRVFTVAPPRIDEVIEKRLVFALNIAEGRVQMERLQAISLQLGNVATFVKVLLASIDRFDDVKIFLENITGGNIRELIQYIASLFGNPNMDTLGAVLSLENNSHYAMPVHEFWKVAMKGDYQYYDPEKALAFNLFDVYTNDEREHFLSVLLFALLDAPGPHRTAEGFVSFNELLSQMQEFGFKPTSVDAALRAANNKRLVEAPERITFEEDDDGTYGLMPTSFRLTTIGAYHLKVWLADFAYLDAICVDTPIFDADVAADLRGTIRSSALADRYARAMKMRDYLGEVWARLGIQPTYFDWESMTRDGNGSFAKVARHLARY